MPITLWITLALITILIFGGLGAGTFLVARELLFEKTQPVYGWDTSGTRELLVMRQERRKEKEACPYCHGVRCWDWVREGRSCEDNPTLSTGTGDILTVGRHNKFSIRLVPDSWWPIPLTRMGRLNPHLWAKVADHAQILVSYRRAVALP